ncbi:Spc7 kinetochore protein-domain-containing protein [Gamsiella multidivaricata]|uniref:Spc7 kinetochore protein-domain-containing protein n=1 Tax=Gamsiella multidivaricata TaxID=101098 RepID=UPI00221E66F5|nr:Spc7 kinetochore protein-domain-containing protein [Gamsiella multidivaricata]KAI7819149.1 Spc7 kinetochore protein-domain-containing protein [Gamsiella multidivaricata]
MDEDTALQEQQQQQQELHRLQHHILEGVAKSIETEAIETTVTAEATSESSQEQPAQDAQRESSSLKRAFADGDDSASSESSAQPSQASTQPSSQTLSNQDNAASSESPSLSSKRRRISMPGKSILKPISQDDDGEHAGNQDTAYDASLADDSGPASDITETLSSTIESFKRNSKSISRRVSFAATARIRMFERDEKEDELPKTMSYLEGLSPNVILNTPFTFKSGSSEDDTNKASNSTDSVNSEHSSQRNEHTGTSNESSDSEKERSFEVSVYPGHSDSTGSSGTGSALFLGSSDFSYEKTPFDDGDPDTGSSSEEENSHFFPDANLMKRSSGIGIYGRGRDSILGPQIDLGLMDDSIRASQRPDNLDDGTQDYSMTHSFQNHRSSIPERLPTPPRPHLQHEDSQDFTNDFTDSQRYNASDPIDAGASSRSPPKLATEGVLTDEMFNAGLSPVLLSQGDVANEILKLRNELGLDMTEEFAKGDRSAVDEDTDMDITAPIGGIQELAQELAQELPPTTFLQTDDSTAMFSELGTPMDVTQPIGAGILDVSGSEPAETGNDLDRCEFNIANIPSTPTRSGRISLVLANKSDGIFGQLVQDESQSRDKESFHSEPAQNGQPTAPSTPPPRAPSFRVDNLSPQLLPRLSLGTPGRFTPSVKARLNIFPEVLEKQLQTLESSTPTEPVFRASHVSPETSSLAKRIYRYSIGAYSRTSGDFQSRLSGASNDSHHTSTEVQDEVMDMTIEQPTASVQSTNYDIFNETPAALDKDTGSADSNDNEEVDLTDKGRNQASTAPDGGLDEDSFSELPPISLSKFLSLVGISFLDHLNASTRRRTIPHRGDDADSSTTYRSADLVKAMALSVQELHSYREACRLLKQSIDTSRAFADDQEKKVSKKNPDYFREFRESNSDTKEFIKDRFKMIKVHSKLETNAAFSIWKTDVLRVQQETLEQHLVELKKDITNLGTIRSALLNEKEKVLPRRDELRRQLEEATERQRSYELCDKEQLASLAEAAEEQGSQIEHYESIKAKKAKELTDIKARVEKLQLAEQGVKTRTVAAEKTIQDNQYVRIEDLNRAKDVLSIIQATHHWEPLRPIVSGEALRPGKALEFVYDKTLKISIDIAKVGQDPRAVLVAEYKEGDTMDFDLSLMDRQRLSISALSPKKHGNFQEVSI